jgi:Family of unknown function (DUF6011)
MTMTAEPALRTEDQRFVTMRVNGTFRIAEVQPGTLAGEVTRETAWSVARKQMDAVIVVMLDGRTLNLGVVVDSAANLSDRPAGEGYFLKDGAVYKIQHNRAHTRLYAKRLVVCDAAGSWEYAPGMVAVLRARDEITSQTAKEFGDLYGVCFRCGRELTREESIERGMGPVCAVKLGW